MNAERPVAIALRMSSVSSACNVAHHQRLRDIANGKLRGSLGKMGQRSKPSYRHISENRKKAQLKRSVTRSNVKSDTS